MQLQDIAGPAGSEKTIGEVTIGKCYQYADGVRAYKLDADNSITIGSGNVAAHVAEQGVYEIGAFSFAANLPPFAEAVAGATGYIGTRLVEKLSDGRVWDLDTYEVFTPDAGATWVVLADNQVIGSFDR